jgi:sulfide:quinone oxidoreductase
MSRLHAVICGGGIAAVEGLLRLRRLAGDDIDITLVAPNDEVAYRPLAVREPFALRGVRRYPLKRIAEDEGACWIKASLARVDLDGRQVETDDNAEIPFDALLVAVGGRMTAPFENATLFTDVNADEQYHGLVQDIEGGYVKSLAWVMPDGPVWPLPLYELALMTAERASGMQADLDLSIVTPEEAPLAVFGGEASRAVQQLLDEAGITLYPKSSADLLDKRHLIVQPSGVELRPERIVTLPRIEGPSIEGLPRTEHGFIPIDEHCRVRDAGENVFAAGDATNFPVKHGGLGAAMADAAAAGIAHLAEAGPPAAEFKPTIHGTVLTGRSPLYITGHVFAGRGYEAEVHSEPPWAADEKIVAAELGPYLAALDAAV